MDLVKDKSGAVLQVGNEIEKMSFFYYSPHL